jgi:Flp pilus assembly protein TadD
LVSNRHAARGALLIFVMTLLAYAPALFAGFIWDDDRYVTQNPVLENAAGLRSIWLDPSATIQYYPLTHTTFWIERHLWGFRPFGFHLVNVLLHSASAVLFVSILLRLRVPGAWLGGAIFALHPVHVESVAWVTERKNVLSGFLVLGATVAYLGSARLGDGEEERSPRLALLSLILFCGALFAKTVAATLPVTLALLIYWQRGRWETRDRVYLPAMAVCAAMLAPLTAWLEKHQVGAEGPDWDLSLAERVLVAGRAFWFYLGKLAWPHPLMFTYPHWTLDATSALPYVWPAAVLALFVALWTMRHRWTGGPLVAAAVFVVTLLPALGFADVFPMRYSYVADHFQYLASLGPIALASAVATLGRRAAVERAPGTRFRSAGPLAAAALLVVLGALTWSRARAFKDDETLWRDTLAKNPDSFMAHNNLAVIAAREGDPQGAIEHLERSLRLKPDYASAVNLGIALAHQGMNDRALEMYRESLRLKPDEIGTQVLLGEALMERGDLDESRSHLVAAVSLGPDDPRALNAMGRFLQRSGRAREAAHYYARAVAALPDNPFARLNLGIALEQDGRDGEALGQFRAAMLLAPENADVRYNLGALLLRQGDVDGAVEQLTRAVRLRPTFDAAKQELARAISHR